jgi:prolipoprotein diacylglyceryltransferase
MLPPLLFFLSAVIWDVNPEIFGTSLRWYGLLFATGFLLGQVIMKKIFREEGKPETDVDTLTYYMVISTVVGARLGHCLFYEPDYYLSNPIEILKIWKGGLASHGATVGILAALYLYSKKHPDQSYLWILDRIVIVIALAGACIRTGNLMNSEILGKPANVPWSFVFVHDTGKMLQEIYKDKIEHIAFEKAGEASEIEGVAVEKVRFLITFRRDVMPGSSMDVFAGNHFPSFLRNYDEPRMHFKPLVGAGEYQTGFDSKGKPTLQIAAWGIKRHPAMIYEALSSLLLFIMLFTLWKNKKEALPEGRIFGLFVVILFSLRFLYEFLKENQVDFEEQLTLNMGQILSLPLILVGALVLWRSFRKSAVAPNLK